MKANEDPLEAKEHGKKPNGDLLDWLEAVFGFQVTNIEKHFEGLFLM